MKITRVSQEHTFLQQVWEDEKHISQAPSVAWLTATHSKVYLLQETFPHHLCLFSSLPPLLILDWVSLSLSWFPHFVCISFTASSLFYKAHLYACLNLFPWISSPHCSSYTSLQHSLHLWYLFSVCFSDYSVRSIRQGAYLFQTLLYPKLLAHKRY